MAPPGATPVDAQPLACITLTSLLAVVGGYQATQLVVLRPSSLSLAERMEMLASAYDLLVKQLARHNIMVKETEL